MNLPRAAPACTPADDVYFFGAEGESAAKRDWRERRAKGICRRCPVIAACRDYALGGGIRDGVWGGMGEAERANLLRRARVRAYRARLRGAAA